MATALPLFHLYGDPPDDQAFDFIHVETIASRSSIHDWTIRAHRHRNLFQILLIEQGGGEMTFEAARLPFAAPAAILVPAAVAHGFRFQPNAHPGLGAELHRGRRRPPRRPRRRGAVASARAGRTADRSDCRGRGAVAALGAVRGTLRGKQSCARGLSAGDARPARAHRHRRRPPRGEPGAHRQRDPAAGRRHRRAAARAGR